MPPEAELERALSNIDIVDRLMKSAQQRTEQDTLVIDMDLNGD